MEMLIVSLLKNFPVSNFAVETQVVFLSRLSYLIAFKSACLLQNFTGCLETLLWALSNMHDIPVWTLIRSSCISILSVKITFAPTFNLISFTEPPLFVWFWLLWAAWIFANAYFQLSGICYIIWSLSSPGKSFKTASFLFIAGSFSAYMCMASYG